MRLLHVRLAPTCSPCVFSPSLSLSFSLLPRHFRNAPSFLPSFLSLHLPLRSSSPRPFRRRLPNFSSNSGNNARVAAPLFFGAIQFACASANAGRECMRPLCQRRRNEWSREDKLHTYVYRWPHLHNLPYVTRITRGMAVLILYAVPARMRAAVTSTRAYN